MKRNTRSNSTTLKASPQSISVITHLDQPSEASEGGNIENDSQDEELLFTSLRAANWDEFLGQETVKHSLQIAISAARSRKEAMDHTLFYGPPGLGKTTLSHLISKEMGTQLRISSGTALTKSGDLAAILTNLDPGDILFIDEIHRLPKAVEESLYTAMEDYALDIVIGKGPSARTLRLDVPKFTLVGATTRFGLMAGPFRDRFGIIHRLDYYDPSALAHIIVQGATKMTISLDTQSAIEIAKRARGTPRIGLKLLKRVRDYSQVTNTDVTPQTVRIALDYQAIDTLGLDDNDRKYLTLLIKKYDGGPVGISTLAAALSEDSTTIEEVIEPYLLQQGMIKRTNQGRVATPSAFSHLGFDLPEKYQTALFD